METACQPMGQPDGKGLHFFKVEALLSDALSVGFMVALAAGYPYRYRAEESLAYLSG